MQLEWSSDSESGVMGKDLEVHETRYSLVKTSNQGYYHFSVDLLLLFAWFRQISTRNQSRTTMDGNQFHLDGL
jgi:hypothetical protein